MWLNTFLTYGFIHFPTELLISEVGFLIHKRRKEHFEIRLAGSLLLYFLFTYGWMILWESVAANSLIPLIFLYLGYAALTAFPILCCFEMRILELVFVIVGGYATQHMGFALLRIFLYSTRHSLEVYGIERLVTQYLFYVFWMAVVYFLIIRKNQEKENFDSDDVRIVAFSIVLVLAAIVLSVFYSNPETLNIYSCILCPAYGALCCVMVLIMEYYVLRENRMKREQEIMEQMLQMADSQQKSAKESIDIINIKCHDLKHQIKVLANMEDAGARSEYLHEIQKAVSIYDATYHTGCKPLDYILREKTLVFNEYDIKFSCMIEGELINFMSMPDIYALMGNALDNALECVMKEKEDERIISLQIRKNGDMVLLHLENRCSRELEFKNGMPITDKEDKQRHGFGVRSIHYIAEKYDGELFMNAKSGRFYLDILFPLQEKESCIK